MKRKSNNDDLKYSFFNAPQKADKRLSWNKQSRIRKEMQNLLPPKSIPLSELDFESQSFDPDHPPMEWLNRYASFTVKTKTRIWKYKFLVDFSQMQTKLKHSTHYDMPSFYRNQRKSQLDVLEFMARFMNSITPSTCIMRNVKFYHRFQPDGQYKGIAFLNFEDEDYPTMAFFRKVSPYTYKFVSCFPLKEGSIERLAKVRRIIKGY